MKMPEFETTVEDMDTKADRLLVFGAFTRQITKTDLFRAAEEYVRERVPNASVYSFASMHGGLMRMVVGMTVAKQIHSEIGDVGETLLNTLMVYYGFTAETIPPRMLVREAVAAQVKLNTLLADLTREFPSDVSPMWTIAGNAESLASPKDAFLLSDAEVDAILQALEV